MTKKYRLHGWGRRRPYRGRVSGELGLQQGNPGLEGEGLARAKELESSSGNTATREMAKLTDKDLARLSNPYNAGKASAYEVMTMAHELIRLRGGTESGGTL